MYQLPVRTVLSDPLLGEPQERQVPGEKQCTKPQDRSTTVALWIFIKERQESPYTMMFLCQNKKVLHTKIVP